MFIFCVIVIVFVNTFLPMMKYCHVPSLFSFRHEEVGWAIGTFAYG